MQPALLETATVTAHHSLQPLHEVGHLPSFPTPARALPGPAPPQGLPQPGTAVHEHAHTPQSHTSRSNCPKALGQVATAGPVAAPVGQLTPPPRVLAQSQSPCPPATPQTRTLGGVLVSRISVHARPPRMPLPTLDVICTYHSSSPHSTHSPRSTRLPVDVVQSGRSSEGEKEEIKQLRGALHVARIVEAMLGSGQGRSASALSPTRCPAWARACHGVASPPLWHCGAPSLPSLS